MLSLQALVSSEKLLLCHMFMNGIQVIADTVMHKVRLHACHKCVLRRCRHVSN